MTLFRSIMILFFAVLNATAQSLISSSFQDLFYTDMKSGVACYRIPALTTAPDGSLLAAIDERVPSCKDLGQNPDINIVIRKSNNNGKDWSPVESVVDFPFGESASDPSFIVDEQTGSVFLFYNYMNHHVEKDRYRFQYVVSKDNGNTWSAPVDITDQISKPEWNKTFVFVTSGNGIQTRDGKLIHTLVNVGEKSGFVFGSADHGNTWFLIDKALNPADESKLVELSDGRWMLNARVNGLGKRYVHITADQGKTWSSHQAEDLEDPGCNAAILKFSDKKHLRRNSTLYFINPASSSARNNLTLKISSDDGKIWKSVQTIYEGSSAYSSATFLNNGDLAILFERDNYSKNTFAIIPDN